MKMTLTKIRKKTSQFLQKGISKGLKKLSIGEHALPEHLKKAKHWDWPKGLKWVPRSWTSASWGEPKQIFGNQKDKRKSKVTGNEGPAPIGEKGSWQISRYPKAPGFLKYIPLYFAKTFKSGTQIRLGSRWDDIDDYVNLITVAKRKYTGDDTQDTSTD